MIDPDNLKSSQIQRKLRAKEFVLVSNPKSTHDIWQNDISLVAFVDDDQDQQVLDGWAACRHCLVAYRTHSKKDGSGSRKNYGLTSLHTHVKECRMHAKKGQPITSTDVEPKQSGLIQTHIPRFAFNKNLLTDHLQTQLKDAELKFVTAGSHSFNALENDGLLDLFQVGIDIGAKMGKVNVRDIFYGRKTIRQEALARFMQFSDEIRQTLEEPIKQHCVAATCDLWTDDYIKRSYLDFTVFWSTEDFKLHHCLLRCKHFPEESKTSINIWQEIKSIFESFNLSFGDTPVVTDQGSNMVAAFKITHEARIPCMAHRCSTTIETAWNREDEHNPTFAMFNSVIRDLRKYVNQSSGVQEKLPKTLKNGSSTRPWRSYFTIHDSLNVSLEELSTILRERNEQYRLFNVDPVLLKEIVQLMGQFSMIFDKLEMACIPTLQNVVPSYYRMVEYTQVSANDHIIIKQLKDQLRCCLEEKYLASILQLHWVATYLDPSFKSFFFVSDRSYIDQQKKEIRKGLHVLLADLVQNLNVVYSPEYVTDDSPPSKRIKDDPFSGFRQKRLIHRSSEDNENLTVELNRQVQIYEGMAVDPDYDNNPFTFWRRHKDDLSLLAKISRSVLVIPASSAESERHFSIAGRIVTELRSSLDPDCVEALVVLKEAYLNKIWPSVIGREHH